ncbi:MAG: hypothetical protein HY664_05170 [Chloroflexi bacterium]|nr:hypothetical protein [Chloroflexota bacterium]
MNSTFSFLFPMFFILGLAVLVAGIAYVVIKVRSGERIDLSFRLLLSVYLYLMTIVSLLVLAVGLSSLVNVGLASVVGRDFSYSVPPTLEQGFRNGLAEGLSLTIVGGLVWALHIWGQRALRRRADGDEPLLWKAYLAVLLGVFSIGGILALSLGVSQTVRYVLDSGTDFTSSRPVPGSTLAIAIVFVPIWIYYFAALWRERRDGAVSAIAESEPMP